MELSQLQISRSLLICFHLHAQRLESLPPKKYLKMSSPIRLGKALLELLACALRRASHPFIQFKHLRLKTVSLVSLLVAEESRGN